MKSHFFFALCVAALASSSAFAQGLSAGTRGEPVARSQADTAIAVTAPPLQSGRSVRRDRNGDASDTSSIQTRICTNCDD